MRLACIGIGSNAIRCLCADWNGIALCNDLRLREGTRLFAGLQNGKLTDESIRSSAEAIKKLTRQATENGAEKIYLFATSAVRDASNSSDFLEAASKASGSAVELISGEQEAILSFIGAANSADSGVIDIGGGSTEFTIGRTNGIEGVASLQMGAVRMQKMIPILSETDYLQTVELCKQMISEQCAELLLLKPRTEWVGVGGTMTTLGAMEKSCEYFLPETCEGMQMSAETVRMWGRKLANLSLEERRCIEGLMPHRADIIPSGIAILEAAMDRFSMNTIRLSAHGNMDGYLKRVFQNASMNK